ncbi:MAG: hypothetical protein ACI35W_06700 [Anaeroplasmataceae bacterium]
MTELEMKSHVREILSTIDYRYDRRIKDSFWKSVSNEQSIGVNIPQTAYDTFIKIVRDSIDKTSKIDSTAESYIKELLLLWNECLVENSSFDASNQLSKIEKIGLKIKTRQKENYLDSAISNIDVTLTDIRQTADRNKTDETYKINLLEEQKQILKTKVICVNTREAGECYQAIIKSLKAIRQAVLNNISYRREEEEKLKEAVERWVNLTKSKKTLFKNDNASIETFEGDNLTYNIKFEEEKTYFNDLINLITSRVSKQQQLITEAEEAEQELAKKFANLQSLYKAGKIPMEQFVRVADPIKKEYDMAKNNTATRRAATAGSLGNASLISNSLKNLIILVDSCSLSTKEKYDILHKIDAQKVMQGMSLNDDSIKFFSYLKKVEKMLTENIQYSNALYDKFIRERMLASNPYDLNPSFELQTEDDIKARAAELMGMEVNVNQDINEEAQQEPESEYTDEELKKLLDGGL